MSGLGAQTLINKERAFYLSSIPSDVVHGTIICDELLTNTAYISTLYSDNIEVSTLKASTISLTSTDVSGLYVSSLRGNTAFFSSLSLASDLSGGVGSVTFQVDASGIAVTGDPIVFNNLVYLTSTINIVQVSTIVDTDIFASNGYFSSLSSGSLSSGLAHISSLRVEDLSGDYGAFNTLSVSSLATNHISSLESGSNWSFWPTQASSIIFQPAYVLSNVSNKLYFAGQELTDASGGGIDWSFFPAQTDVSMNNFSLRALSTLQYQDGGRLYSQTGNNLFYNGQPVQFGSASNVSQWANYVAVNTIQTGGFPISSLGNINLVANSNVRILADSFSTVADQGLFSPTANSDINLTAQNGLKGRINMTANPGALGLFGEINMTANGGTVAGVGTGGLVSITANTPLGTLCNATSAIKLSASGINSYAGAIPSVGSLAGYNFIYGTLGVNIVAGPIPSVIPNTPTTTFLYGTSGVVSGSDFYTPNIYPYWNGLTTPPDMNITGRYIVPNLAQVYVNLSNVKRIYMDSFAEIQNARYVSTVSTVGQNANFNTGTYGTLAAGAVGASAGLFTTLEAGTISTGFIRSPLVSTININLSTINGVDWQDISGGVFTTISSFNDLKTSTMRVSSLKGFANPDTFLGSTIQVENSLQFLGTNSYVSSLLTINNTKQASIFNFSTLDLNYQAGINPLGYVRVGGGGAFDSYFREFPNGTGFSTQTLYTQSTATDVCQVSTLSASGGLPIKVRNTLQFETPNAIDNVDVINLNPLVIPALNIGASTIFMDAVNTRIPSLSSLALQFSTASCFNSNGNFTTALNIVQDTAGSATGGVQISVEGRSLTTGAVRNVLNMGFRASDGVNFVQAVWPGQNLEDLAIEGDPVRITDGALSTIFNQNPYALQTTGGVAIGQASGLITLSTGLLKVGGQTNLTPFEISTTFINTPYGNNLYYAGLQQPAIQFGKVATSGGSGSVQVQINTPYYANSNFVIQATMEDTSPAEMAAQANSISSFTLYWSNGGGGSHTLGWTTLGNLPFTG